MPVWENQTDTCPPGLGGNDKQQRKGCPDWAVVDRNPVRRDPGLGGRIRAEKVEGKGVVGGGGPRPDGAAVGDQGGFSLASARATYT